MSTSCQCGLPILSVHSNVHSLGPHGLQPTRLPVHGFQARKLSKLLLLPPKIFLTQGSNPHLRKSCFKQAGRFSYHQSHLGKSLSVQQFYFPLYFSCTCHEYQGTGQLKGRISLPKHRFTGVSNLNLPLS